MDEQLLRTRHALHAGERIWPESNCYVDLWIGALHAYGFDPSPMLLCALAPRFEVDQWTFCKPTASELAVLYGIRVEELNIWRSLREQVELQVHAGRLVLVETDAFHLPDTVGVSYGIAHQKTTIGVQSMQSDSRIIRYFHNAGCFTLSAADFDGVFDAGVMATQLPPFAEFADVTERRTHGASDLKELAANLARGRFATASHVNPFDEWATRVATQIADLASHDLAHFHAWAFATVRQAGSMAELAAHWCTWMDAVVTSDGDVERSDDLRVAAESLKHIAQTLSAQQFRLARVPGGGTHAGFHAAVQRCAEWWTTADRSLRRAIEAPMSRSAF